MKTRFWENLLGNRTADICVSVVLAEQDRMQFVLPELMLGLPPWLSATDRQSMRRAME